MRVHHEMPSRCEGDHFSELPMSSPIVTTEIGFGPQGDAHITREVTAGLDEPVALGPPESGGTRPPAA